MNRKLGSNRYNYTNRVLLYVGQTQRFLTIRSGHFAILCTFAELNSRGMTNAIFRDDTVIAAALVVLGVNLSV